MAVLFHSVSKHDNMAVFQRKGHLLQGSQLQVQMELKHIRVLKHVTLCPSSSLGGHGASSNFDPDGQQQLLFLAVKSTMNVPSDLAM